jgi:hypothetical protein
MNLPNFKDILKIVSEKLSVFRNNVPLLVSVIIALAGILLFVPTQLLSSGLKKEINQKSVVELASVLTNVKQHPVSSAQLEAEQKRLDKISNDANSIELLAIQTTQRQLLSDSIFKLDPNDANSTFSPQSIVYEFGRLYRNGIDEFIKTHNARSGPEQDELERELQASGIDNIMSPAGVLGRSYDTRASHENIQGMMVDQICRKIAESTYVYIDPLQISGYEFWSQFTYGSWDEDIQNCWYSQLGYWVIQDLFDTIVAMNKGHESLVTAPVKRLMKVTFSDDTAGVTSSGSGKTTGTGSIVKTYTDRPRYIFSDDEFPKETLSGRYSDVNYDVIHFKATFVINTQDYPRFVRELCSAKEHKYTDKSGQTHTYKHNQITLLDASIRAADMKSENHQLYQYGDDNVSEVELTCEYLFNVKGYLDVMPKIVKDYLGLSAVQ